MKNELSFEKIEYPLERALQKAREKMEKRQKRKKIKKLNKLSDKELKILANCRKNRVRLSHDVSLCHCSESLIGNISYDSLAGDILRDSEKYGGTHHTNLKRLVRKWWARNRSHIKLTPDEYDKILSAIRCRFTAKAQKTRERNKNRKIKESQLVFDFLN